MGKQNKKTESISYGKKVFYRGNMINFSLSIFFILGVSAVQIGLAFLLRMLMDAATNGTMKELRELIVYSVIFLVISAGVLTGKNIFVNLYLKKATLQFKNHIFGKILSKNINSFNNEGSSTYISAFSNDLNVIENNYLNGKLNIILQISTLIGGLIAMIYLNWIITICILATSILPIIVSAAFGKKIMKNEQSVSAQNANFIALVKDLLSGFTVIKSFKVEKQVYNIFENKNNELEQKKIHKRIIEGLVQLLASVASTIVELTVFGVGVYFAITGKITVGVVVAFIQLLNYVLQPISVLGHMIATYKAAEGLIIKNEKLAEVSASSDEGEYISEFKKEIRFKDVSFGYEEDKYNIREVSQVFEKGKSYAIVGASGSGKSTMLNMLLSYHNNYEGSIYIDNHELRKVSKNSIYDIMSIIQQNVFIFDNTIKENITLFNEYNPEDVDDAIKSAGLSKLIQEKGEGYKCGENGNKLSGGEKQRISIARCLLRKTPILLMDEGTSSLDSKTARMVEETILNVEGLTKIIVTHKMDSNILQKYDHIVVMNKGEVVECGNYDELIEKKGYFYSLYNVTKVSVNKTPPCIKDEVYDIIS